MNILKWTVIPAVVGLALVSQGCLATKKNVQQQIAPVQAQVNQTQKQAAENKQAIGDLDRQVAGVDEKAVEAGKRAQQAAEAAQRASDAAAHANDAANQAGQKADAARASADQVGAKLDQDVANLDNYHLRDTQKVYFGSGKSDVTKDEEAKLDQTIQSLATAKNYVIEVEGFTDRIGSKDYNLALSQRRADAVLRYLTLHNIPLRKIHVVGVGNEDPNAVNKTRADRKENRRVDLRVYTLDLTAKN
ncbi:MAG: OmpA family protein [Bryobacteraceae bacterium]|jgi:outer membrane protein OmpA-like peptidoglycan-associated protein